MNERIGKNYSLGPSSAYAVVRDRKDMVDENEGLLVKTEHGTYRWGRYRGYSDNFHCCLLARVSVRPVLSPAHEISEYGLDRELTQNEVHAIVAADHAEATEEDRAVISALAREIGVPV